MSQSLYPVTRESPPPYRESGLTKVLAILLLVVAGALVFTVWQQKKQGTTMPTSVYEPKPIAQRPDDKLGADEQATIDVFEANACSSRTPMRRWISMRRAAGSRVRSTSR